MRHSFEEGDLANTQAPFGFERWGVTGGSPNFSFSSGYPAGANVAGYRIAAGYATALFYGDAVRMNVSGPTGYIEQWANGDGATATKILAGIFLGCSYYSTGQRQTIFNKYWPGSDATGDVTAFVCDDPSSIWKVQAGVAAAITQTSMGQTADIVATPVGNTTTLTSGMSLSTPTTTNTLPFKVVGFVTTPPTANGTDLTTPYNYVLVGFNNQLLKSLLGV